MSNYSCKVKILKTGEIKEVYAQDNYFGNRQYGYADGEKIYKEDEIEIVKEEVENPYPVNYKCEDCGSISPIAHFEGCPKLGNAIQMDKIDESKICNIEKIKITDDLREIAQHGLYKALASEILLADKINEIIDYLKLNKLN